MLGTMLGEKFWSWPPSAHTTSPARWDQREIEEAANFVTSMNLRAAFGAVHGFFLSLRLCGAFTG